MDSDYDKGTIELSQGSTLDHSIEEGERNRGTGISGVGVGQEMEGGENAALKDEEDLLFRYSRATNRPIHYGNIIPLFKDKNGIPRVFIGPDCTLCI